MVYNIYTRKKERKKGIYKKNHDFLQYTYNNTSL